jgi:hypothetical protein
MAGGVKEVQLTRRIRGSMTWLVVAIWIGMIDRKDGQDDPDGLFCRKRLLTISSISFGVISGSGR